MEYAEEKTVFDFEDESIVLSVWIDKYVDDPIYVEEGDVPDALHIRRNGLACGRNFEYKDGGGFSIMFAHEIMMTSDVVGLRDGVRAFLAGDTNHFGPFPQKDPYGGDSPFFTLELKRNSNGESFFRAQVDEPGSGKCCAEGPMSKEQVAKLGKYYSQIVEWFPPRMEEKYSCRKGQILTRLAAALHEIVPCRLFKSEMNEAFYAVVWGRRYSGRPSEQSAVAFMNALRDNLEPDERLELNCGRIVIVGPDNAYRIHFNFEGCGKHAGFTADFRDPSCPIVTLGRISMRMLRRQVGCPDAPPAGMFNPDIIACIPDPVDRYASLLLNNQKLAKRIPKTLREELSADNMAHVARKWHKGQFRKDGKTPYIEHPKAVAILMDEWGFGPGRDGWAVAVAWGHDIIEETPPKRHEEAERDIRRSICGLHGDKEKVLDAIRLLSRNKDVFPVKADYIRHVAENASQPVLAVKIADRICNTRDFLKLEGAGLEKARDYFAEGEPLFEHLGLTNDHYQRLPKDIEDRIRAEIELVRNELSLIRGA